MKRIRIDVIADELLIIPALRQIVKEIQGGWSQGNDWRIENVREDFINSKEN